MELGLVVILFLVVLLSHHKLSNKIRKLENEIFELNKLLHKNEEHAKKIPEQTPADVPSPASQNISSGKLPEQMIDPGSPQKDWLTPILDFLKQNILTVIGIFTLVLGIGYFVKYAIDKNWIGETARAMIGLCTGAGIIITGHFLRKNYTTFSSIITGGGIAVLYFSTTIAFREYHIFSQNTAFIIICLITFFSILISYYYNSQVLIIFSLFGGFLAPLMVSTGQSNYPFLLTYITILNLGMLIIVFLKHWKNISWIAFIFTHIYLFYWVIEKTEMISIYFYVATYIIFYTFALHDYRKTNTLSIIDILMLVLINFTSIIGLVYIFNELKYEPAIIFPLAFALVNALLLYREHRKKNFEIPYSVFTGITVSLITLTFALQFEANLITSVWAVEATLLLFIWKKTGFSIFKICFYVLFPLVIIVQMITWIEYLSFRQLSIVFNPVFLTSLITIITILANLYLLRRRHENDKPENKFIENLFIVLSYTIIYLSILFEILYHLSDQHLPVIISSGLLFSIYYIFILLLLRKPLSISEDFENGLLYLFIFLVIIHISLSASMVTEGILKKEIPGNHYFFYMLYLIPFMYICWKLIASTHFFKVTIAYWYICFAIIVVVSSELYHGYILMNAENLAQSYPLKTHFSILYLPIIWTILASIFIYTGLKRNVSELNKIGFVLVGIVMVKLYAYDVWQMDNISRIIAFIILGIILLLSSFMFQRLKNIIKNLVDHKNENTSDRDSKS
ncbi:DUF2339 domain-containing protein [Chryseobacterium sp. Alg-005]|uniref:DUF2339 domain-containing protein n=1 Tax=Chryseobacterium sp. Alg-005 TaxID=3159516 RepID=UPI003555B657